jgi:hexosaminidase
MKTAMFVLLLLVVGACFGRNGDAPTIIPKPVSLRQTGGAFQLSRATTILVEHGKLQPEAEVFNEFLERYHGFTLKLGGNSSSHSIVLVLSKHAGENPEAYTLSVTKDRITVTGGNTGVFYGLQTLAQLLVSEHQKVFEVPCLEIQDTPRFGWRGMHLDVCRHFFAKEFVEKYIDEMAMYKMNTFHWHLTEDQGWRIEIKKYPKLTQVGAWRNGSMVGPYDDQKFDSIRYGGFYTQKEIKEIVAYAKKRHITIVPEIEMPGHSLAALAAYPELSCTGGPFEVGKAWGVYDDVYCPKEATFTFLENVLTEVCALFPGKYIHIGGDECPKTRWKKCEHCQARIKKHKLKNENGLQSYFIGRIEKILNAKGKQLIGWDEILDGGLAPNAAVMSWRGITGGIEAAKQKHYVVMSPGSHCYFDYYQGTPQYEPLAIGGYTTVEKVYSYEPTPAELSVSDQKYILGAQGNVWTEYIPTPEQVEYMAFPRMIALAEVVWSPKEQRDYHEFRDRLLRHLALLDNIKINYSHSIYEITGTVKQTLSNEGVEFVLSSAFDSAGIQYTLDGSDPTTASMHYQSPIAVAKSMAVKFAYFDHGKLQGRVMSQPFVIAKSTGKKIILKTPPHANYPGNGAFTLVDGIRGDLKRHGQHWLGWWGPNMEAMIDLNKPEKISKITMDVFNGEGSWIYLPKSIQVFVSDDSVNFKSVKKLSEEEIKSAGNVVEIALDNQRARYVKVIAENAGKIPDGKPGAGHDPWLFVDEIIIE